MHCLQALAMILEGMEGLMGPSAGLGVDLAERLRYVPLCPISAAPGASRLSANLTRAQVKGDDSFKADLDVCSGHMLNAIRRRWRCPSMLKPEAEKSESSSCG